MTELLNEGSRNQGTSASPGDSDIQTMWWQLSVSDEPGKQNCQLPDGYQIQFKILVGANYGNSVFSV